MSIKYSFSFLLFTFFIFAADAKNYFQQEVNYTITVELDDVHHTLRASETIVYKNNSPDKLNTLYFHLYPNAYKSEGSILGQEDHFYGNDRIANTEESERGSIDSLHFKVNGEDVNWELLTDTLDICRIHLNKALAPNDSIVITTPFKVKIPVGTISRMGHLDQKYFLTQWYPKPAVYDANGWNYFPYMEFGEFYSEFGKFDVYITVPSNYIVAATGELSGNPEEEEFLEQKSKESAPDNNTVPPSSGEKKTLHYSIGQVHDFAWFANKNFRVKKGETILPESGRKINTWCFYTNEMPELWENAIDYIDFSLKDISRWVGEYPYNVLTAVDVGQSAGSGMEYPTIMAIGDYGDTFEQKTTIAHEVAHQWFYGILGNNERMHAWMDEGITTAMEIRFVQSESGGNRDAEIEFGYPGTLSRLAGEYMVNHRERQYFHYLNNARKKLDQNPDQNAFQLSLSSYFGDVYSKSGIAFDYLKSVLGDSVYDRCMHTYFDQWKFKHPDPTDIQTAFEQSCGKDLNWFFKDMICSNKKTDYSLCKIQRHGESGQLTISNKGEVNAPIRIGVYKDSVLVKDYFVEGFSGQTKIEVDYNSGYTYKLDPENKMPDLRRQNNELRASGLFRKSEPLRIQLLPANELPGRTSLYCTPIIGFNKYNSLMPGVAIYNYGIQEKKVEFTLAPMYSIGRGNLTGSGNLQLHHYPKHGPFHRITLSEDFRHYNYADDFYYNNSNDQSFSGHLQFSRINSQLIFSFRPKGRNEKLSRTIALRYAFVQKDLPYIYKYKYTTENYNYYSAEYQRKNSLASEASLIKLNITVNQDFLKVKGEISRFLSYSKPGKGFEFRIFGGYADIHRNIQPGVDYRFSLDGMTGERDFIFDQTFLGRSETSGFYAQQFYMDDAGFKVPTLFYNTADKWMAGINLSTTLPGLIPFRLFFDAGTYNDFKLTGISTSSYSYDYGISLPIFKDVFTIYVPVGYSEDIKYIIDREELHFGNLIRFEIKFNELNPLQTIRTIFAE